MGASNKDSLTLSSNGQFLSLSINSISHTAENKSSTFEIKEEEQQVHNIMGNFPNDEVLDVFDIEYKDKPLMLAIMRDNVIAFEKDKQGEVAFSMKLPNEKTI